MRSSLNKYSPGKYLRNLKKLRKSHPNNKVRQLFQVIEPSPELKAYIDEMTKKGVTINKLNIGEFQTKNGLPYTGFIASEEIITNEHLIRVPRECLLTTKIAYMSDIKQVFQENSYFFHKELCHDWEDHMLLFFILYEFQKKENSNWFRLIQNLPKELDYVVFWPDEDLLKLNDWKFLAMVRKAQRDFEYEFSETVLIMEKYPEFFDLEAKSYDNIKWVYTHLVTRCFGKYLEYITMVPIVELFNHENSDVFYDFDYKKENQQIPDVTYFSQEFVPMEDPARVDENIIENYETSDESNNTQDALCDSDFDYSDSEIDFNYDPMQQLTLQQKENKQKIADIHAWLIHTIDFDDNFSVLFVGKIMKELEIIENDIGKIEYFKSKEQIELLQSQNLMYKHLMAKQSNSLSQDKDQTQIEKKIKNKKILYQQDKVLLQKKHNPDRNKQAKFQEDELWVDDKFDHFVMKASKKDQFEKNSQVFNFIQVFFCYGRNSNRWMLLKYGFSLEYNKYDHVHIKLNYFKELQNCKYSPKTQKLIQKLGLSKYKRFKLRYKSFNYQIIQYFKACLFDLQKHKLESLFYVVDFQLELEAINVNVQFQLSIDYLNKFLKNKFQQSPEQNEKLLYDKNLGYHDHFSIIYRLERQRIILYQIGLLNLAKCLWEKVKIITKFQIFQHTHGRIQNFLLLLIIKQVIQNKKIKRDQILKPVKGIEQDIHACLRNRYLLQDYLNITFLPSDTLQV